MSANVESLREQYWDIAVNSEATDALLSEKDRDLIKRRDILFSQLMLTVSDSYPKGVPIEVRQEISREAERMVPGSSDADFKWNTIYDIMSSDIDEGNIH